MICSSRCKATLVLIVPKSDLLAASLFHENAPAPSDLPKKNELSHNDSVEEAIAQVKTWTCSIRQWQVLVSMKTRINREDGTSLFTESLTFRMA